MPDIQHSFLTAGGWLLPGTSALCPPATPHPQFGGPLPLASTHGCERYPTLRTHRPSPYPSPYTHRDNSPSKSQVPVDRGMGGWEITVGKTSAGAQGAGWKDLSRAHTQAQCLHGSGGTCHIHATERSSPEAVALSGHLSSVQLSPHPHQDCGSISGGPGLPIF